MLSAPHADGENYISVRMFSALRCNEIGGSLEVSGSSCRSQLKSLSRICWRGSFKARRIDAFGALMNINLIIKKTFFCGLPCHTLNADLYLN